MKASYSYNFFLKTTSFILIGVLFSYLALSQEKSIRFQHFTIEDGLPQNMVDCIWEDSKGLIWFGTENGLSAYDGLTGEFTNYFHSPFAEFSLVHNSITDILENSQGNIVIATLGGLSILEARIKNLIESRKTLLSGYSLKLGIKPDEITSTKVDEQFLKKAIELVENNLNNSQFRVPDLINS